MKRRSGTGVLGHCWAVRAPSRLMLTAPLAERRISRGQTPVTTTSSVPSGITPLGKIPRKG